MCKLIEELISPTEHPLGFAPVAGSSQAGRLNDQVAPGFGLGEATLMTDEIDAMHTMDSIVRAMIDASTGS